MKNIKHLVTVADDVYVMLKNAAESPTPENKHSTIPATLSKIVRAHFATEAADPERNKPVDDKTAPRNNYDFGVWLENATQAQADALQIQLTEFCNANAAHPLGYRLDYRIETQS
jgi:hypothetical protein